MELVPAELLIAAAHMAMSDHLTPSQTMTVVLRAIDHELRGPDGKPFNPARTAGIGEAIYAAMFGYPLALVADSKAASGWRWQSSIPEHGYGPAFQQSFLDALVDVGDLRRRRAEPAA
ncbi:hypothetical protein SAMN02745857_02282 [Andreprevotia lacus DSM 23236]|jgi:hypothetical protein|uniref:Uncharacterized protein n=1 Tax=Andreprevotia lacus DSM 23236 TaxID=1121001 RepID=A0A1W1XPH6_9NEIS|nr:hypothetical protein [Andreprevotia lacus]SMC25777.1 hypothetical protein SAMN02745857_02282 [Andreprevotia lacus DSM 23236]